MMKTTTKKKGGPALRDLPLWALHSEHSFVERSIEGMIERQKKGKPAHKKWPKYEKYLKERLKALNEEIERRKKEEPDEE